MDTVRVKEFTFGELKVVAEAGVAENGRTVLQRLEVSGTRITPSDVREIPVGRIEASFVDQSVAGDLESLTKRATDETRSEFIVRVAAAYRAALLISNKPAVKISEHLNVPTTTVHGWIREARLRGLLPPGEQGRVG